MQENPRRTGEGLATVFLCILQVGEVDVLDQVNWTQSLLGSRQGVLNDLVYSGGVCSRIRQHPRVPRLPRDFNRGDGLHNALSDPAETREGPPRRAAQGERSEVESYEESYTARRPRDLPIRNLTPLTLSYERS